MYKVKLSIDVDCINQTPGRKGVWGNYQFDINGKDDEYDFWVVYSKGVFKTEKCRVAPENTMMVTGEPSTIYHYSKGYVNQFGTLLVCRDDMKHPNQVYIQPAQPWFIGRIGSGNDITFKTGYDDYKGKDNYQKTKLISVISSNKAYTKGHQQRIDFVQKLKAHFGDQMDVFGRGFNGFDDKWDVVAPYKYHIAIENSAFDDYWTEKLADSYIGGAYPIYYGCKNVEKYFDKDALTVIDIHDVEQSIKQIEAVINSKTYENKFNAIIKAKNQVLDEYNLFAMLAKLMDQMNPNADKKEVVIKADTSFFDLTKLQTMGFSRIINGIKRKMSL